jgi:hypothetical protein
VSGLGEADRFLGATTLALDAAGSAPIALILPNPHGDGVITATATDAASNTSKISPCIAVTPGAAGAGQFQLWRNPFLAYEDIPTVEIAVVRSHGLSGNASVRLCTQDTSATAPADYTAQDVVLNFADGEWLRTMSVPVVLDSNGEGDETFYLRLIWQGEPIIASVSEGEATILDEDDSDAIFRDGFE